ASVVFFFQAEDGIRARNVTGVQTCALPISPASPTPVLRRHERPWAAVASTGSGSAPARLGRGTAVPVPPRLAAEEMNAREGRPEIGRASCRERVETEGGAGAGKRGGRRASQ